MPTAIVTGASKGLGFAFAAQLADSGWNLIIDARDPVALHRAADALRAAGSAACRTLPSGDGVRVVVEPIVGDITDPEHRSALLRAALAHGRLDLLVNNAGTLGPSPLPSVATTDLDTLRQTFEVNTIAPLALTQLALPLLRTSRGIVIDLTSDAAIEGYPGWGGYGGSKAATEQLRNVLAAEETDVLVWRLDPGDVQTDMHQLAFPGEDISDRPLPETVAPALMNLLATRPASGRYRLANIAGATVSAAETGHASSNGRTALRLWLTAEVEDHATVAAFYRDALGLPDVDGWSFDGEAGTVFAVGTGGRIEIEQPAFPEPPQKGIRAAIEYADIDALTAAHDRLTGATQIVAHPRGHSGFSVRDPSGVDVYLWTEKAGNESAEKESVR